MKTTPLFLAICLAACSTKPAFKYPVTRTEPFDTTIYDVKISDPYFWMSRKANEDELKTWANAQGKLTQRVLDSIPNGDKLAAEIEAGYLKMQDEIWNLTVVNEMFYYYRDVPEVGPSLCKRKNMDAEEEIVFGGGITINGQRYRSRKNRHAHRRPFVAMMLVQRGEANPHIRIYDLDKKIFLPDSIAPVMFNDARGVSMTWLPDDSGLLYSQAPPTKMESEKYYNGKIKLHTIGNTISQDEAVFGMGVTDAIQLKDFETPYIYSFNSSEYLLARIRNGADDNYAFAVHYKDLKGANTPWKRLNQYANLGDGFDAQGQYLYAATKDHPRYTIVQIDMSAGNEPVPFMPAQDEVLSYVDASHSSGIVAAKDALYVLFRKVGDMGIYKIDYRSKRISKIKLNRKGSMADLVLKGNNDLVFGQFSALHSMQYMLYQHDQDTIAALPFSKISLDLSNDFVTEVISVPARDGKKIPVSLIYKKGLALKNNNALYIEAYGNGGAVTDLWLDPHKLPWMSHDGIYAYAHVRGGGELGLEWIDEGQFPNKMNSINDMVDVAEYFVDNNYTSADKQFVMGGSAGSFLVGNSINQRPDLFAGGIFQAGLPDLATYRDAAYARECGSVGDIETKEGFESVYSLSSLYHIPKNTKLPAMLVVHGGTDYIIDLTSPSRYVATLQAMQQGTRPQLFMVDWEGGHLGGGIEEVINTLKFMLWQSGHPTFQPTHKK
ncbi:MAG: prolyl oligopeptidase family serine peptidase [Cyclobacteriaceae bacterium]|nr:prolyl oligopeptidase family serine peptidase [Cyclobacteriaceae bacterium]